LAFCDTEPRQISAGKIERLAPLFPGSRNDSRPFPPLHRRLWWMPAGRDGLDDSGRQEGLGPDSADVTCVHVLLVGDTKDRGYLAVGNPFDPPIRSGHKIDKASIGQKST